MTGTPWRITNWVAAAETGVSNTPATRMARNVRAAAISSRSLPASSTSTIV
jgi:hypothetical protein